MAKKQIKDWVKQSKPAKIGELKKYEKNPKIHTDTQIKSIMESMKRFGIYAPAVINSKGIIVAGHGRIEAARRLKLKEFPCIRREDLSENDLKALRLIDNKIAETEWDEDVLRDALAEIDFDFDSFSINFDELGLEQDVRKVEIKEEKLQPYKKVHVLLSMAPDIFVEIEEVLKQIKEIEEIEYETSAN